MTGPDVLLLDLLDLLLGASIEDASPLGTSMSSMAIEMPARVARLEAVLQSLSAKTDRLLQAAVAVRGVDEQEISFFFGLVDVAKNGRPARRDLDSSARPTVV